MLAFGKSSKSGHPSQKKALAGFVKCTSCVKYASRVKCAAAREGDLFHFTSNRAEGGVRYFTISARKLFHIRRKPNISLFLFPQHKTVDRFEPPLLKYLQNCGIIHIVKKRGSH